MPYESESEIARWQRLGFVLTTPERQERYLHLSLGARSHRIVATDHDFGSYRVVAPPEGPESDGAIGSSDRRRLATASHSGAQSNVV